MLRRAKEIEANRDRRLAKRVVLCRKVEAPPAKPTKVACKACGFAAKQDGFNFSRNPLRDLKCPACQSENIDTTAILCRNRSYEYGANNSFVRRSKAA